MVWHFHNTFKIMSRSIPYLVFHEAIQHEGNSDVYLIIFIQMFP